MRNKFQIGGSISINRNGGYDTTESDSSIHHLVFGPVPSRRLGMSLGINNIPPKKCPYSCIYCQVGATNDMGTERREFFGPDLIIRSVGERLDSIREKGERVDHATFVPDGEPTLDIELGTSICGVSDLGVSTAVITNGSLLWIEEVREDLYKADLVSVKVDSVDPAMWKKVDRPSGVLELGKVLDGIREFSENFQGRMITETMLVEGVNDNEDNISGVAGFLSGIGPHTAYISIPTRPPVEKGVKGPGHEAVHRAYTTFKEQVGRTGLLTGPEGNSFQIYGELKEDIGAITAVHPIREGAMEAILERYGGSMDLIEEMIEEGIIERKVQGNDTFYTRK